MLRFRFPIVIIDEDFRSENTSGLGIRALADAIMKEGVREKPDVAALASRDENRLTILSWHYHDDDVPGPAATVTLNLAHVPAGAYRVTEYRVDATHSNAQTVWKAQGAPTAPTAKQYAELVAAGKLATTDDLPKTLTASDGTATLTYTLPRQAVSLIVLER